MFTQFGPAPLCLELDFDSFDGPPHWVARLRRKSGWLMVAKATIQSEHDILTDKLVVACDEQENPIPSFKAANLIHCDWINPTYCDELPPDILEDLICQEEGSLIARWHREKNTALAEAFEDQEARIAELEGRVRSMIARNELQIAELRQRRRHPDATPEMRLAMQQIVDELDTENDELLAEMAESLAAIREQSAEFEEALWARDDLLIDVTPLHIVRWKARAANFSALNDHVEARRPDDASISAMHRLHLPGQIHELRAQIKIAESQRHTRAHVRALTRRLMALQKIDRIDRNLL